MSREAQPWMKPRSGWPVEKIPSISSLDSSQVITQADKDHHDEVFGDSIKVSSYGYCQLIWHG